MQIFFYVKDYYIRIIKKKFENNLGILFKYLVLKIVRWNKEKIKWLLFVYVKLGEVLEFIFKLRYSVFRR